VEAGTEEVADHTAGKEELSVSRTAQDYEDGTDLLVVRDPAAGRIDLDLAVDRVGLRGVGILHNHHSAHRTDLAGHVPAVHTAVAVGQVEEVQKEGHNHPVDQVVHLRMERIGPIGV
jgi:hypothetical protein